MTNEKESPAFSRQGKTDLLSNEMILNDDNAFVYRQCFGVFLDIEDCESCEARRQCKAALFVVDI